MEKIVSITSQGQLTIPKTLLREFGINKATKAVVRKDGDNIVVSPKPDFWSLAGSANTKVKLTDEELRKASAQFEKKWAVKV